MKTKDMFFLKKLYVLLIQLNRFFTVSIRWSKHDNLLFLCQKIRIRPDEGLTLEMSAFESLYGGQFTLSTQLIKPNYLVILPPTQHHSFFRNLPPLLSVHSYPSYNSGGGKRGMESLIFFLCIPLLALSCSFFACFPSSSMFWLTQYTRLLTYFLRQTSISVFEPNTNESNQLRLFFYTDGRILKFPAPGDFPCKSVEGELFVDEALKLKEVLHVKTIGIAFYDLQFEFTDT